MNFKQAVPILRIFDEHKAKEFYIDFLGFKIDWEHRFEDGLPLYFQISKGDCRIHLTEHHGDCSPGGAIRIETDNIENFHKKLVEKKYKNVRPGIQHQPWDSKEMDIKDPFSNRITFFETITNL